MGAIVGVAVLAVTITGVAASSTSPREACERACFEAYARCNRPKPGECHVARWDCEAKCAADVTRVQDAPPSEPETPSIANNDPAR